MTDIALPPGSGVDPASVLTSLADIVRQGSTPKDMYPAICVAATLMVPGCDRASLMIRGDRAYSTAAATDAFAHKIDKLEQLLADGPCIDAIEEDTVQLESDLAAGNRWPALTERVVAETPVRGAMSIRVSLDRGEVGAVNLFSDTSNVFDDSSVERARVLAAFASVATSSAAHGEEAAALRRALASNRTIGKAIGMLMVLNEISADDAFGVLRRISQDTNAKIADVAADFIRRRSAQQP
ncbi:GAF and ANTAR domain-containing protein [Mycobacterium sp.]|uniref:GAF and ANTAR domain-containing protein n=1 Tax=Mycobacterium sp. TaxID=1785 RepID=UPI003C758DBF